MRKFAKGFLLGAATAAHQVEGNNKESDCWTLENMPGSMYKEPSLDAVDHYRRYEEDIALLASSGLGAYRFSIEWARIEPRRGEFDAKEIEHYRNVLLCCRRNGVTPVVTFHHFSSPKWLTAGGGWESEDTPELFAAYCRKVASELSGLIPYACTINEANMGLQIGRIMSDMESGLRKSVKGKDTPDAGVQVGLNVERRESMAAYYRAVGEAFGTDPRKVQPFLSPRTPAGDAIIIRSHVLAREAIRAVSPATKVGLTLSLYDYQSLPGGEGYVARMRDEDFVHYLPSIEADDFLGVQNYSRKVYGPEGRLPPAEGARLTDAGYEFYPEALAGVLRYVSSLWKKPILVTENGISTNDDADRLEFIEAATSGVMDCLAEGIDVRGYMYWSLLDNFEWSLGFAQRFGLVAVDRATQERKPKASLAFLGSGASR